MSNVYPCQLSRRYIYSKKLTREEVELFDQPISSLLIIKKNIQNPDLRQCRLQARQNHKAQTNKKQTKWEKLWREETIKWIHWHSRIAHVWHWTVEDGIWGHGHWFDQPGFKIRELISNWRSFDRRVSLVLLSVSIKPLEPMATSEQLKPSSIMSDTRDEYWSSLNRWAFLMFVSNDTDNVKRITRLSVG